MRTKLDKRIMALIAEDTHTTEKAPVDWGLYYPVDYIFYAWHIWRISNFVVYPNGHAYDDQDPQLIADFNTLNSVYAYQKGYAKEKPSVDDTKRIFG